MRATPGGKASLIFRYLVQHARAKKADREVVAAVHDAAVDPRRLLQAAPPTRKCLPLADAAKSRSEADWAGRPSTARGAMTAFNSKEGGFYLTTVGPRTDSGRLAILVEARGTRFARSLRANYWEVHARFGRQGRASIPAAGSIPSFKKDDGRRCADPERLWGARRRRRKSVAACRGKKGVATGGNEGPPLSFPPLLFRPYQPAARSQRTFRFSGAG